MRSLQSLVYDYVCRSLFKVGSEVATCSSFRKNDAALRVEIKRSFYFYFAMDVFYLFYRFFLKTLLINVYASKCKKIKKPLQRVPYLHLVVSLPLTRNSCPILEV